jgi:hypothetical protein
MLQKPYRGSFGKAQKPGVVRTVVRRKGASPGLARFRAGKSVAFEDLKETV